MTFDVPSDARLNEYRRVAIKVDRPNLVVRARQGTTRGFEGGMVGRFRLFFAVIGGPDDAQGFFAAFKMTGFGRQRLRHASVNPCPGVGHGASGSWASLSSLGDEVDLAEDAGGDGLDFVEVLHLEAVAVFVDEGFVVVGRLGWTRR